jgi:hypothetical protein
LIPATLSLLDSERQPLRTHDFAVDVQGSLRSVYGVFGLAVCASTVVLASVLVLQLASNRLPANRWNRATRFAVPGLGIGLTLTVTLSVLHLVTPSATAWVTLVVGSAGVAFLVGYLTPTPESVDTQDGEDEEDEGDLVTARPAAGPRVVAQRAPSDEESGRPAAEPGGRHWPPSRP